jgi:hypothetical protein
MKPIIFKECNSEFAKDQKEYNTLPAFRNNTPQGEVITCWNLTFRERFRVLLYGCIWLNLLTFNKPLTPSFMTTNKFDIFNKPKFSFKKIFHFKQ